MTKRSLCVGDNLLQVIRPMSGSLRKMRMGTIRCSIIKMPIPGKVNKCVLSGNYDDRETEKCEKIWTYMIIWN